MLKRLTKLFMILYKRQQPSKVIVIDCDDTLWDGVCDEDGNL